MSPRRSFVSALAGVAFAAVLGSAAQASAAGVVYSGEQLTGIDFPVGPLGHGGIQHLGDGTRNQSWIFNVESQLNTNWNRRQMRVPHSFFAIRAKTPGGDPVVRALQTVDEGPFAAMDSLTFRGEYPLASYSFAEDALPISVVERVNSVTVGGDLLGSSYPTALYEFELTNESEEPVTASLLATQQNAVGFDGQGEIGGPNGRTYQWFGTNKNSVTADAEGARLDMTGCTDGAVVPVAVRCNGSMALSMLHPGASGTASWPSHQALLDDFAGDGTLAGPATAQGVLPNPTTPDWGETVDGALSVTVDLEPGESQTIPVVLSWYIPTSNVREFGGEGVYYANRWKNAQEVDAEVTSRYDDLQAKTRLFHDTLYDSNLPHYVLDRLTSQMATLHTPVVFWAQNGFFGGFEGHGCCTSMPTHVWQYAQLAQRLWPEIDRKWTTQWLDNELPGGLIPYRYIAPQFAMDGQNGVILGAYRYWLQSGDRDWLLRQWLKIKQAMDFVINRHDPDRDGIVTGEQLTTLDSMSSGANPWLGTMYLAAVRASQRMAEAVGDPIDADLYATLFETGRVNQEQLLWNGEWYVEKPETVTRPVEVPEKSPAQDVTTLTGSGQTSFGNGVIADMLLGQWWAGQLGLGEIYDSAHMTTAMRTLFRENFRESFVGHDFRGGRVFVEPEDEGLVMMSWPKGDRPANATKYADEVWSGQEYSAAALLIQRGLVDEGLRMVKAVFDRYDGRLRTKVSRHNCAALDGGGNPFGDDECGKWYARAMSNWSVLLALQGFAYDAAADTIGFAPKWQPENHRSFFSAGNAWGTFEQKRSGPARQTDTLAVKSGTLTLRRIGLDAGALDPTEVEVSVADQRLEASLDGDDVKLDEAVALEPGDVLEIELR
jgi:uncharacterized protein (DUF608 family)